MRVLIACEFSGTVRDAFIKAGHNAMSCDLEPTEAPGPHYQGDVMDIINDNWDMMIAFPPCTHLAVSGARHFEQKRKDGRQQQGIDFFLKIVNANIPKIAIENPVGIMSNLYKQPTQIIQPYEYGHEFSKKTCLWLKNLPPLMATMYVEKTESTKVPGNWFNKGGKDRQKNRAKTFEGIANAMAQQWGN